MIVPFSFRGQPGRYDVSKDNVCFTEKNGLVTNGPLNSFTPPFQKAVRDAREKLFKSKKAAK